MPFTLTAYTPVLAAMGSLTLLIKALLKATPTNLGSLPSPVIMEKLKPILSALCMIAFAPVAIASSVFPFIVALIFSAFFLSLIIPST